MTVVFRLLPRHGMGGRFGCEVGNLGDDDVIGCDPQGDGMEEGRLEGCWHDVPNVTGTRISPTFEERLGSNVVSRREGTEDNDGQETKTKCR